jgi:hypothetical protein
VFALLLLVFALYRPSDDARIVSLAALVLVALVALPVYFTGDAIEDRVEKLPGVSEAVIDRHKDAAGVALAGAEVLGAIGVAGLVLVVRRAMPGWFIPATVALTIVGGGLMAWTASVGGQIRHTEIRAGGAR